MLAPHPEAKKRRRPTRAKLNKSSRTKTSRKDRKKDKEPSSVKQFEYKIEKMIKADELLLPKLFDDAAIEAILGESNSRKRVYTVPTTLSLFVQQVLMKDRGCKEVVLLLNRKRQQQHLRQVSCNTTSYCDARARIPLSLLQELTGTSALPTKKRVPLTLTSSTGIEEVLPAYMSFTNTVPAAVSSLLHSS